MRRQEGPSQHLLPPSELNKLELENKEICQISIRKTELIKKRFFILNTAGRSNKIVFVSL
jgi:hypothetical protein